MVMTVLPSMRSSFGDNEKKSAETLANGSRTFNVGIIDYTAWVSTLNPFMYTTSQEYMTIYPCYSTLLTYDINAERVGDLATSWSLSPDGLTWNFKLAQDAYFVDPASPTSTAHQVTAKDVMWTYWEVNNDTANHLSSSLRVGGVGIIDKMWTGTDQWDLYVSTKTLYSPFIGALTAIPIVPEYIWGHLTNPITPRNYRNLPPIGSGAFYCTVTSLPLTAVTILKRNPQWFQELNRGWQIHVDTLQYKSELAMNAWADLTATPPLIDVYLNVPPSQFVNPPGGQPPGILGWAQSTGFVYEYQLNQLSNAERAALNMNVGSNNQILLNPTVKLAMAMCVDKQVFVDQVIMGLGSVADSLVPDCNPWHYTYPNPVQFNPTAARALLMSQGWAYDSTGAPAGANTVPLCQAGGTNPLSFRLMSLTSNSEWATGCSLLAQWAALGGVQLNVQLVSVGQANSAWYAGDYDTWLWDWVFSPTSDPSTDCQYADTTMAIGSWSGSYWHNASYDDLYNRSLTVMDPVARRQLTDAMQASVYEDHNDQLIAYAKSCYLANTYNWYGPSYGDWATHWTLIPDQGFPWLYMQLSPTDNHAPTVTVGSASFGGYLDTPMTLFGSATDGSPMLYQWYWGDGSESGWQSSPSMSHTYTTPGFLTAYLAAQEQGTADGFISWDRTYVSVIGYNFTPIINSIVMTPSSGIVMGTMVTFAAIAVDPEGDPLYYNWNFGDTFSGTGATVNHQFMTGGLYTVVLSVTDNQPGLGRPATMSLLVPVAVNHPPVISINPSQVVLWKVPAWFSATASDGDNDTLRFTWVWGDGTKTVTTSPKNVTHTYIQKGSFSLYVYADDLTGLPGHNVSALCNVRTGSRSPPYGLTLSVDRSSIWVYQSVIFTATAQDPTGDGMHFTIKCGDGTFVNVDTPTTGNNAVVTVTASHTYLSAGIMAAQLYVTDGLDNTTDTTPVYVTVTLNHAPFFTTPPTNKKMWQGNSTSFLVAAFDADGEPLRYTWNFGDGSWLVGPTSTSHTYAKAGTYTYRVYVDDLTGLAGHNVTLSATARIAFNLPLLVGWNFVSVPLAGYGYRASNISLATGDMISSWNSTAQKYDHTYIKGISPPMYDFAIAPNAGYWIWVAAAKTIHLYGSVPTATQTLTVTVPSGGGWIAAGFLGVDTVYHASDITKMYSGTGAITLIAYYENGKYHPYIPGLPPSDFWLVPGQGYWCWVTAGSGGTISYMPDAGTIHTIG
jgi:ABC-type transport system substrate-binding protein/PKD repeat protein